MKFIGELAALGASVIWATSISLYKRFGAGQPAYVLTLFKNIIALILFAICLFFVPYSLPENINTYILLSLSGLIGVAIGDTASMAALSRVGAQLSSLSLCIAPPMASVIACYYFYETMTLREIISMLLIITGCAGAISARRQNQEIVRNASSFFVGIGFIVICALANAIGVILARESMQDTGIVSGTFIRTLPVVVVLSLLYINKTQTVAGAKSKVTLNEWLILSGIALFGSFLGLLLFSIAVKYAKAGVVTTLIATTAIWIIPISHFLLKETCSWLGIMGSIIACAGVALLVLNF